jgi:hypothetical protein
MVFKEQENFLLLFVHVWVLSEGSSSDGEDAFADTCNW